MSWPQACITGTSLPSGSVPVAVLAYASPVRSRTGSASKSARSSTRGPAPLASTPTTPVRPTPVITSKPSRRSSSATTPAVRVSANDSSGYACRSW